MLDCFFFFFNDTATTEIYTLTLHDALPIWVGERATGGELASREQDLRRRMVELTEQLQGPGEPEGGGLRDPAAVAAANVAASDALSRAQEAYAELLTEMREANPAYAAPGSGEIPRTRAVMAAVAPDQALLEYLIGDST